jgi:hypothetical protein
MTSPAARAFTGSFMTAFFEYSLPGPWQLSQSSGGLRAACAVSDHEANCTSWQVSQLSLPTRLSPGFVAATATVPPLSTTAGAGAAAAAGAFSTGAGAGVATGVGDGVAAGAGDGAGALATGAGCGEGVVAAGADGVAPGCAGATSTGEALLEAGSGVMAAGLSADSGAGAAGVDADSGCAVGAADAGRSAGPDGDPQPASNTAIHISAPPRSFFFITACLSSLTSS